MSGSGRLAVVVDNIRGERVASAKLPITADGRSSLLALLQRTSDYKPGTMHIALEDPHGVIPATLQQRRYDVQIARPLAVARAREAATAAGSKDDMLDAALLARIVRSNPDLHSPLRRDSDAAAVVLSATRAHREQMRIARAVHNQLHAHLASYYPAALRTFSSLEAIGARTTLSLAGSPAEARRLHPNELRRALKSAGAWYCSLAYAKSYLEGLRSKDMHLSAALEAEQADRTRILCRQFGDLLAMREQLHEHALVLYERHPWYAVFASFPALGGIAGARILAELGDDRERFGSVHGWQSMAGVRPVTKQSGSSSWDHRRYVHNRVLGSAVFIWVLPLTQSSPAAKLLYDRRKAAGDRHGTATRKVACAYLDMLWACVRDGTPYDESRAMERFTRQDATATA